MPKKIELPTKARQILDLRDLPEELLIVFEKNGQEVVVSKSQLLLELNSSKISSNSNDGRSNRTAEHNKTIGISQSFTTIWKAINQDKSTDKALNTLEKALANYDNKQLKDIFRTKLQDKPNNQERKKVVRFLNKHLQDLD